VKTTHLGISINKPGKSKNNTHGQCKQYVGLDVNNTPGDRYKQYTWE